MQEKIKQILNRMIITAKKDYKYRIDNKDDEVTFTSDDKYNTDQSLFAILSVVREELLSEAELHEIFFKSAERELTLSDTRGLKAIHQSMLKKVGKR